MKSLIQSLMSLLSFSILVDALIKRYAAKKGFTANSPEAILGFYKSAGKKILGMLIVALPIYGQLVYFNEESKALFGGWLDGITGYTSILSEFFLFILVLVGLPELAIAILWVILKLLESNAKAQEIVHQMMVFGAKICLGIAIVALIAAEADCVAIGGMSKAFKLIGDISFRDAEWYITMAAYLASICYFVYIAVSGLTYAKEFLLTLCNKVKAALEESKRTKAKTSKR